MPYFEFDYWPFDDKGNDDKIWELTQFPKAWAEHPEGEPNIFPYYNNDKLNWYQVEIEEENTILAFQKGWDIIARIIDLSSGENYYRITYFWSNSDGDIEIDWSIYSLEQIDSNIKLNYVYPIDTNEYYVIVKDANPKAAFEQAVILIENINKK